MIETEIMTDAVDDQAGGSPVQAMAEYIRDACAAMLLACDVVQGEIEVRVNASDVAAALGLLRDDPQAAFSQLIDLTAVDYPDRQDRFDVIYQMLSMHNNMRLRLVAAVGEGQAVPSATGVFMSANWAEREVWDMFGIFFAGHPDLRRLLTDYGFEGHPLRKDFPLSGHVEVRYDDMQRRVINEPVHLVQEFS
jgi:NADH-quinone oxidoreductase subunit C